MNVDVLPPKGEEGFMQLSVLVLLPRSCLVDGYVLACECNAEGLQ